MESLQRHARTQGIANGMESFNKKGILLWLENGQLHYKAPKGALTPEEIAELRARKDEIIALLTERGHENEIESTPVVDTRLHKAPLTFSQLARWNSLRQERRPFTRSLASAMRLYGPLDIDSFRKAFAEIVRRHDALRTQIVVSNGMVMQEISTTSVSELNVCDLSKAPEEALETEVNRLIELHMLKPCDPAKDPLLEASLITIHDREHVLILALEHIISDAASLSILIRELSAAYFDALEGRPFSLPRIDIQFPDYAAWQRNEETSRVEQHGAYWLKHLAGCRRLRFPLDDTLSPLGRSGWGTVPVCIGRELRDELQRWCRSNQTTLTMCVFAAYVVFVLRWCDASEAVFPYQTDGRVSGKIDNTIGYFAAVLYLRIALKDDDSFLDLLQRVTEEYCKAYDHADLSYIDAQIPQPDFTLNSGFNWVPDEARFQSTSSSRSNDTVTSVLIPDRYPVAFANLEFDCEPCILLTDLRDEVTGTVSFPLSRFSAETMTRFSRSLLKLIAALISQPTACAKSIPLQ